MITIEDLIQDVRKYNPIEELKIRKAYELANELHSGQFRQSGEPYIIHPLSVAMILSEMRADSDTICAALLHDVLEDASDKITKEDIAFQFNPTVAELVDGVTKISKLNFSSKGEENEANTRKIMLSLTTDVRIVVIKLADRLHNMSTLDAKSPFKQKENALETMELYVPLAYYFGAYSIKNKLEDLCLRYLKPDLYFKLQDLRNKIEFDNTPILTEMSGNIKGILGNRFDNDITFRIKNIYGIYKKLTEGKKISDIHDLLALKVIVDTMENCYLTLGLIHNIPYHPINSKFKDYICLPKTNGYQSLHTTLCESNVLVQTQIRTFEMDRVASFGLISHWAKNKGEARDTMQRELNEKLPFYRSLVEIDKMFADNTNFIKEVKKDIFSKNIYVYVDGKVYELPEGATIVDLAFKISNELGYTIVDAIVKNEHLRDERVSFDYELKNKDIISINSDKLLYGQVRKLLPAAKTCYARSRILENIENIK